MKCSNPVVIKGQAFPCSGCLACRINRRRLWAHRIMLEAGESSESSFVTLTYSDQNLPRANAKGGYTLLPSHLKSWLKRLRRRVEPQRLRYFAVGEYGERNGKPHYHAAIFGGSRCQFGRSRYSAIYQTCCPWCELIRETWGHGNIFVGELNMVTAQYVCGYVTKKMTRTDDVRLEDGQWPEFARMSLKPGIGAVVVPELASTLMEFDFLEVAEDVPSALRHGRRLMPLGRYLKQQTRLQTGMGKEVPKGVKEKMEKEMSPLRSFAFDNSRSLKGVVAEFFEGETQRLEALEEFNKQRKRLS